MKTLPNDVEHFRSTPVFTETTVPKGLLKDHNTKNGVWGLICMIEGEMEYVIEDNDTQMLTSKNQGVIEPEVRHYIKPLGSVSFFIEFYK